jgi:predicted SnoaL-like aldol condensation-catalyzing enzyme
MGMFDTIQVHASVLKDLIDDEDIIGRLNSPEEKEEPEYFSFQTKSLDSFLDVYTLKEDKWLYKTACQFVGGDPEYESSEVKTNTTAIVDFYDYFHTEKYYVSLEIQMTVIDGQLSEMHVTKLDKEPIEVNKLRHKHARLQYEYKESTWEMKVYRFLQKIEWKMWRLFRRVDKYSNLKQWLTQRADAKLTKATKEDEYYNL